LVYVDLDNFKVVNDTVGHAAGDRLLGHLAFLLKNAIRSSDRAFRFGGDEFVLLLHTSIPDATLIAERVRSAVEEFSFTEAERAFGSGASIGIAEVHGRGDGGADHGCCGFCVLSRERLAAGIEWRCTTRATTRLRICGRIQIGPPGSARRCVRMASRCSSSRS
jgi:hypothetical protein